MYPISLCGRQITGSLVILVLVRYLPVYDYGEFASFRTIAALLLIFANAGFNEYILVSSRKIIKETRQKVGLFILNSIFIIAVITVLSLFLDISSKLLFFLVLVRTFLDSTFFLLVLPYFQVSKNFKTISCINIFYSTAIMIIAGFSYAYKLSLINFLLFNILLGIFNFIQISCYAKINYFLYIVNIKSLLKKLDKSILSYITAFICSYLYGQIPVLFVSVLINKEIAALFFAAQTISLIINMLTVAQIQKTISNLINAAANTVREVLRSNLKLLLGINSIILIFFILFGKQVLQLIYFNPYYMNAYPMLIILTLSNILITIAAIYGAYITAAGNQKYKIPHQIIAIFISVIVLCVLHNFGVYSACIAYFISSLYVAIMYTQYCFKLIRNKDVLG